MEFRRWTPLIFLVPGRYVPRETFWRDFDLDSWSTSEYRWLSDDWRGYRDFAQRPHDTVEAGRGDCEDYALIAAACAVARDRPGVGLAFCWEWPYPWPRHVVAYDDERVYSSGQITEETLDDYLDRSRYDRLIRRPVR